MSQNNIIFYKDSSSPAIHKMIVLCNWASAGLSIETIINILNENMWC